MRHELKIARKRKIEQSIYDIKDIVISKIRRICIQGDIFPPVEIHDGEMLKETSITLLICFAYLEPHVLFKDLTINLTINLLDLTSQLIQMKFAGVLSNDKPYREQPEVIIHEYNGLFDENKIDKELYKIILLIFDKAQENSEILSNHIFEGNSKNETLWLTLE